jgi:hypothetical protein
MTKEINFRKIASRFDMNISALRIFTNQIGQLAEEHDKNITVQRNNAFADMVGISVEDLEKLKSVSNSDFQLALKAQKELPLDNRQDIETKLQLSNEQKIVIQKMAQFNGKEFSPKTRNFLRASTKVLPIQASILRRSALITLASHLEYLVAELIHAFYLQYPQALPSDERVLSLSELRAIGSIEDAENHLIDREVDALLRDSIEKQLEYFSSKRIRVNLDEIEKYKNNIIEIFQRRNLIVHNDGVVNKIYLSRISKELQESEVKEGERLSVKDTYLNNAIDSIYLCGITLIQICWRKWGKETVEAADTVYAHLLYEALQERQYNIINSLQDFSLKLEFSSDRDKRIVFVNHAIALREQKQHDKMKKLIDTLDWSSTSLEFRVALCALKEEKENLLKILPTAIAAKEIKKYHLEEWPLFAPFREYEEFVQITENCIDEPDEIIESD